MVYNMDCFSASVRKPAWRMVSTVAGRSRSGSSMRTGPPLSLSHMQRSAPKAETTARRRGAVSFKRPGGPAESVDRPKLHVYARVPGEGEELVQLGRVDAAIADTHAAHVVEDDGRFGKALAHAVDLGQVGRADEEAEYQAVLRGGGEHALVAFLIEPALPLAEGGLGAAAPDAEGAHPPGGEIEHGPVRRPLGDVGDGGNDAGPHVTVGVGGDEVDDIATASLQR